MTVTEPPPVIVIGMHRSGTSLVVRLLDQLGLFTGWRRDQHAEALLFQQLNIWLLRQAGGAWDHPAPVRDLLDDDRTRSLAADYLRLRLDSPRALSYLGPRRYLQYRGISRMGEAWGWKDPRNTLTLPIWLDVFPGARVVHLLRHGVDVAVSLVRRRNEMLDDNAERYRRLRPVYRLISKRGGFSHSVRCRSLEGGLTLWEEYVETARSHVEELGDRAIEVRYEDLLRSPQVTLSSLATELGLGVPGNRDLLDEVVERIDSTRAFAFRENRQAREFEKRERARLERFGY